MTKRPFHHTWTYTNARMHPDGSHAYHLRCSGCKRQLSLTFTPQDAMDGLTPWEKGDLLAPPHTNTQP